MQKMKWLMNHITNSYIVLSYKENRYTLNKKLETNTPTRDEEKIKT